MGVHARVIQSCWRRRRILLAFRQTVALVFQKRLAKWREMNANWKQNWGDFESREHVVIHIPSLSLTDIERSTMFNFPLLQNSQFARICDATKPNVDVLYLSSYEIAQEVQQYFLKLLEVTLMTLMTLRTHPDVYS